jgi:hypothetical protein
MTVVLPSAINTILGDYQDDEIHCKRRYGKKDACRQGRWHPESCVTRKAPKRRF